MLPSMTCPLVFMTWEVIGVKHVSIVIFCFGQLLPNFYFYRMATTIIQRAKRGILFISSKNIKKWL